MSRTRKKEKPVADRNKSFFWWEDDTLVVNILGRAGAKRDAIGAPKGQQLKVSVTAAPDRGRATDHMLRFLAGKFGVSASAITLVFGQTSANKQVRIKAPKKLPDFFQRPAS